MGERTHTTRIRRAGPDDALRIAELHAASWRANYRGILRDSYLDRVIEDDRAALWRSRFAAGTGDDPLVLVLQCNDRLIGFVCVSRAVDPVWGALVDHLHVAPTCTGRGFGRILLRAAAEALIQSGDDSGLHLWVFEQNVSACRFYEQLGGARAERALQREPDGSDLVSLRYTWRSARNLIDAIAAAPRR